MIDEVTDNGVILEDGRSISFQELGQILSELAHPATLQAVVRDRISVQRTGATFAEVSRILDAISILPALFAGA